MLLLIIGFAIGALGVKLTFACEEFAYILLFMVGLVITVICTNQPLSGWVRGKTIKEYRLVPLIEKTHIYVIYSGDGNYMYRYVDEYGKEMIKCSSIAETFIDIEGNREPTFVICEKKAKKTLWAFPIGCTKWQNILYIPKDSVIS